MNIPHYSQGEMRLICISGSSGVGKTTVSKLIQSVLGSNESLILSGDDLNKWDRKNPIWDLTTHLNPSSNDLEVGHKHNKVILHTHPTHLIAILCSKEAKYLIDEIFHDFSFDVIDYTKPVVDLVNSIRGVKGIVFLENHGLIVVAETAQEAFETTERINSRCRRWLANHLETIVDLDDNDIVIKLLFPDAAVLSQEMSSINTYTLRLMTAACLTPKYLDESEVSSSIGMASEQYRKSLS